VNRSQSCPPKRMNGIFEMNACPPLVSIGLPVYNGERYLSKALDSLLAQTFKDFELIIADNGSTDKTESICLSYASRDKRIRYYREKENRGISWNFNRVFELSRGRYFKWAASDDICEPTFVSSCVKVLDRDPSIVCCFTKTKNIDRSGNVLDHLADPTEADLLPSKFIRGRNSRENRLDATSNCLHRRFHDILLSTRWGVYCYGLMRTESLRRTGLILPYFGYEKVMMAELSLLGRFHVVPEFLFSQRIHPEASSNRASAKEKQRVFDPNRVDSRTYLRLHLLKGHIKAVWRFPLKPYDRMWCCLWIIRYLLQVSKWKTIMLSILQRTETGKNHQRLDESGDQT